MAVRLLIMLTAILVCPATGNDVVIGILGSSVSIECSLPLSDTLVWEDSSGNILAMNGHVSDSVTTKYVVEKQNGVREILVIHNVTLADDMQYRCYDLTNKTAMEVSKLNVLVKPPLMQVLKPKEPSLEGTEVTLVCEADGGKPLPDITWYRKDSSGVTTEVNGIIRDVIYANNTGNRRHILVLNVTKETYLTSYICNISVSVFYQRSLKAELDVHLMPQQPVISGYDGGFDVDKVLSLECTTTGSHPTATIYWLQDNQRVGEYEFIVIKHDNGTSTVKSFFKRIMSLDFNASVLTCAVTNGALEKQGLPPRTANLTLLASYKPVVTVTVNNQTAEEGGDVTLQCHVDARPATPLASVTWLYNGRDVDREAYVKPIDNGVFGLQLHNVSRSASGEYSCRASNRLGVTTSPPIAVTVHYTPVCASSGIVKVAARPGSTVRLRCQVTALPNNVTLLWRYQESGEIIKTAPSTVDINSPQYSHGSLALDIRSYTQYTRIGCYGINTVGQGHAPCVYEIVNPSSPDPPTNCSATPVNDNISLSCGPGFNGGSAQHFMLQKRTETGYQTLMNSSLPAFSFSSRVNLTVRMCAVNVDFDHVNSCAADVTITVKSTDDSEAEPVVASESSKTAYIAGGVTACVGLLIIAVIVIVLFHRRQKVCFHTKHARFPFSINHHRSSAHAGPHSIYSTSFNTLPSSSHMEDSQLGGHAVSKQFLTDGSERSIRLDFKMPGYGCRVKRHCENNYGFTF